MLFFCFLGELLTTVILPEKNNSLSLSGKFAIKIERQQTEEKSSLVGRHLFHRDFAKVVFGTLYVKSCNVLPSFVMGSP